MMEENERNKKATLEKIVFGIGAAFGVADALLMGPDVPLPRYFTASLPLVIPAFVFTYVMTKDLKTTSRAAALIYGGHLVGEACTTLLRHYS